MKIGVVSDSHGDMESLRAAVSQMGKIDMLIHAGDHYNDGLSLAKETKLKVVAVTGNCDWPVPGKDEGEIEVEGRKILVTHGNKYNVKTTKQRLIEKLKKGPYDMIIYGHSHVPEMNWLTEGILFNPGSTSRPRDGSKKSYGIVEVGAGGIKTYIHELKW